MKKAVDETAVELDGNDRDKLMNDIKHLENFIDKCMTAGGTLRKSKNGATIAFQCIMEANVLDEVINKKMEENKRMNDEQAGEEESSDEIPE